MKCVIITAAITFVLTTAFYSRVQEPQPQPQPQPQPHNYREDLKLASYLVEHSSACYRDWNQTRNSKH